MEIIKRPMMETVVKVGGIEISVRDIRAFLDFMFCVALLYFGYQLGLNNALQIGEHIKATCPCYDVSVHGTKIDVIPPTSDYTIPIPIEGNQYIPQEGNVT